jgi:prepilin-type N-terminal cleavage/methylation domain-containing protein
MLSRLEKRDGFSLIEVIAVVVVLAVAAVSSQMLAPSNAIRSIESAAESRKLVAALRMARSTAVIQQIPVRVRFLGGNQNVTGFVIEQQTGATYSPIAPTENWTMQSTASSSAMNVVFAPTGTANNALRIAFQTGRQTHQVSIVPATGMVSYAKR